MSASRAAATLLNTGAAVSSSLGLLPREYRHQGRNLRLTKLPVNAHANTVLVSKLKFHHLRTVLGSVKESGASILYPKLPLGTGRHPIGIISATFLLP
jgi:hypothetical protein